MTNQMKSDPQVVEEQASKPARQGRGKIARLVNRLLNGEFLARDGMMKHLGFIGYVVLLVIINISIIYYYEDTERGIVDVQRRMEEAKGEQSSFIGAYESERRQSKVAEQVKPLGLHELTTEPEIIEVKPGYFTED
ncbi:MAG: hypothetical protein RL220_483 [Bacteroidota bacterium]